MVNDSIPGSIIGPSPSRIIVTVSRVNDAPLNCDTRSLSSDLDTDGVRLIPGMDAEIALMIKCSIPGVTLEPERLDKMLTSLYSNMSIDGVILAPATFAEIDLRSDFVAVGVTLIPAGCEAILLMDAALIADVALTPARLAKRLMMPSCVMLMPGVVLAPLKLAAIPRIVRMEDALVDDAPDTVAASCRRTDVDTPGVTLAPLSDAEIALRMYDDAAEVADIPVRFPVRRLIDDVAGADAALTPRMSPVHARRIDALIAEVLLVPVRLAARFRVSLPFPPGVALAPATLAVSALMDDAVAPGVTLAPLNSASRLRVPASEMLMFLVALTPEILAESALMDVCDMAGVALTPDKFADNALIVLDVTPGVVLAPRRVASNALTDTADTPGVKLAPARFARMLTNPSWVMLIDGVTLEAVRFAETLRSDLTTGADVELALEMLAVIDLMDVCAIAPVVLTPETTATRLITPSIVMLMLGVALPATIFATMFL